MLEADAPERWDWPEIGSGKFAADVELAFENGHPETVRPPALKAEPRSKNLESLEHLLEAVYAGSPSLGWAESELVPVLEPHLPRRHFVWDFLRALAEAGWLEPVLSVGWRARRWRLRWPSLLPLSPKAAFVEGAVAAAAEHRLVEAVSRRGGRLTRQPALSEWAPSALFIEISDLEELANELAWPICEPHAPEFAAAPRCWPEEQRTTQGRELSDIWSFEAGLFLPPTQERKRKRALCSSAGFGSGRTIGMCFALFQRDRTSLRHPELQRYSRPIGAARLRCSGGSEDDWSALRGPAICRCLWRDRSDGDS